MLTEPQRQNKQNNINTTFDFQKQVDLTMQASAFGRALMVYVLLRFLRSNGFSVILWHALGWNRQVGIRAPSLWSLSFASIKRLTVCCRAQMVCHYHDGEVVPFKLRQWKEDTPMFKILIHNPSAQTKSMTIKSCLLDAVNLLYN